MDRLGGQWWSLNSNQFIATASSFTTHDDYCCGMNTIFKNWLKSARYCQVFFLEYIEYIRIPINPPRSYIAPGHLGVYPLGRWAPPAPHLLPPLPPMSYELRCWIQALERAQNPPLGTILVTVNAMLTEWGSWMDRMGDDFLFFFVVLSFQ